MIDYFSLLTSGEEPDVDTFLNSPIARHLLLQRLRDIGAERPNDPRGKKIDRLILKVMQHDSQIVLNHFRATQSAKAARSRGNS